MLSNMLNDLAEAMKALDGKICLGPFLCVFAVCLSVLACVSLLCMYRLCVLFASPCLFVVLWLLPSLPPSVASV